MRFKEPGNLDAGYRGFLWRSEVLSHIQRSGSALRNAFHNCQISRSSLRIVPGQREPLQTSGQTPDARPGKYLRSGAARQPGKDSAHPGIMSLVKSADPIRISPIGPRAPRRSLPRYPLPVLTRPTAIVLLQSQHPFCNPFVTSPSLPDSFISPKMWEPKGGYLDSAAPAPGFKPRVLFSLMHMDNSAVSWGSSIFRNGPA